MAGESNHPGRLFALRPRLAVLAGMIPRGSWIADIGSDHAYLPIRLLHDGHIAGAVATDISEACVERARENARRFGVSGALRLRCCDGLSGVSPREAQVVIIAGLGGETIASILHTAPWALDGRLLLLQPVSKAVFLRQFLYDAGCGIVEERLAQEGRRLYSVIAARGGHPAPGGRACAYASPALLRNPDPVTAQYLSRVVKSVEKTRSGCVLRSDTAGESAARDIIKALRAMEALVREALE